MRRAFAYALEVSLGSLPEAEGCAKNPTDKRVGCLFFATDLHR